MNVIDVDYFRKHSEPDTNGGCWLWTRMVNEWGYGKMYIGGKKNTSAHRASFEAAKGSIPDGMFVCHSCDTPSCVNPDHLWLGSHVDNQRDMYKKGRGAKALGESHGRAKLTQERVNYIRSSSEPDAELAERFSVSRRAISLVRSGRNWAASA